MTITRYVNYPITPNNPLPQNSVNYTNYTDAAANADDGDTISIYSGNILISSIVYTKLDHAPKVYDIISDDIVKVFYTFVETTNPLVISLIGNEPIYIVHGINKFRLKTLTQNTFIEGINDFSGARITLNTTLPSNHKLLIGIADVLDNPSKNPVLGFYVKLVDATNFVPDDYYTTPIPPGGALNSSQQLSIVEINNNNKISLKITYPDNMDDDSINEFVNKLINLTNYNDYLRPSPFKVTKTSTKNFTLEISNSGVFILLDHNNPIEYSLTTIQHSKDITSDFLNDKELLAKRSARKLFNNGSAPMKGNYNGWGFKKTTNNIINWNLYNYSTDQDITNQDLEYFWVNIMQISDVSQNIYLELFDLSGNMTELNITTPPYIDNYTLWYSGTNLNSPPDISGNMNVTLQQFNGDNVLRISKVNIKTKISETNKFYLDSFGYQTPLTKYNLTFRQYYDNTIDINKQLYLSSMNDYLMLFNNFVNPNSSYPMDRYNFNDMNNYLHYGWYFDSTKDLSLNLMTLNKYDPTLGTFIQYDLKDFHTIFIEVIIKSGYLNLECFNKISPNFSTIGRQIIYINNDPFSDEPSIIRPDASGNAMLANIGPGNINNGVHKYVVTFYSRTEETPKGNMDISINIIDNSLNGVVYVYNIPISNDSRVLGRNIYRTKANENIYYYLGSLGNNLQTSFIDSASDNMLIIRQPPPTNTKEHNVGNTFGSLSNNLLNSTYSFYDASFSSLDKFNGLNLIVGDNSDIELISFGYKILGERTCQYNTRFYGTNPKKMIKNIDGYFLLQKDSLVNFQQYASINESMFTVKAYGDFIKGYYYQNPDNNNYNDIKITVELNEMAVKDAFYFLEKNGMNNYTIDTKGLIIKTDFVGIVDNSGNIIENNSMMVNNKYIFADFSGNNINNNIYMTNSNNIDTFNKKGGLSSVVIQAVYGAIFKQFNKSSSIFNISNSSFASNIDLATLLNNEVKENNIPLQSSNLYKLYESSGRLKNDSSIYGKNKRNGNNNLINLDLDSMEIKFNCKLRGLINDKSSYNINKQMSQVIFGKYNNGNMESQTLVREVVRFKDTTFGYDEKNYKMDMINNLKDGNNKYIVNKEIQYEITFTVSLIQKNNR